MYVSVIARDIIKEDAYRLEEGIFWLVSYRGSKAKVISEELGNGHYWCEAGPGTSSHWSGQNLHDLTMTSYLVFVY